MNKKISLAILFFSLCIGKKSLAQKPVIIIGNHTLPADVLTHEGNSEKQLNQWVFTQFLGSNKTSFFISDETKTGKSIAVYDIASLKKTSELKWANPVNRYGTMAGESIIVDDNKLTNYYISYDKKNATYSLNYASVNLLGHVISNGKSIVTSDISDDKNKSYLIMAPVFSKDKSKMLVYRTNWFDKQTRQNLEFWLMDSSYKELFHKKYTMPYDRKKLEVRTFMVSNSGEIIVIATCEDGNKVGKNSLKVFGISRGSTELKEISTDKGGSWLTAPYYFPEKGPAGIIVDATNQLFVTGLYEENNIKDGLGIAYVSIDLKSMEVINQKFNKISAADQEQILTNFEKTKIGKDYTVQDIHNKNTFYTNSGEVRLVYQVEYLTNQMTTSNNVGIDHFNQIIEFDMSPVGELTRTIIVPKFQQDVYKAMSFISFFSSNKIYHVYNDHLKNLSNSEDPFHYEYKEGLLGKYKNAALAYVFYSPSDNKLVKKAVYDSPESNVVIFPVYYSPNSYFRLSDNSVIVWSKQITVGVFPFAKITFGN
jgi:hypothetical protein